MNKKRLFWCLVAFVTIVTVAYAAGFERISKDHLIIGTGTSTDKVVEFDSGLSPNKSMTTNAAGTEFNVNIDSLLLGDGTATDKNITFDIGGSNPSITWDNSDSKLKFSNDGATYKSIGSGAGAGNLANMLTDENWNFEDGDTKWTESGSAVFSIESTNPLFDLKSGKIDFSAISETLVSQTVAIPEGLYGNNCEASFAYRWPSSVSGNIKFTVKNGSDVAQFTQVELVTTDVRRDARVAFTCPTSGSLYLELEAQADAAILTLDSVWLGSQTNLVDISQAEFWGTHVFGYVTNCLWGAGNDGAYATQGTDSDCSVKSNTGYLENADTDIAGFKTSVQPAKYEISVQGLMLAQAATECQFALYDGTNYSGYLSIDADTLSSNTLIAEFEYTSPGEKTYEIRSWRVSGTGQCRTSVNLTTGSVLEFKMKKFPLGSQSAVSLNTQDWRIETLVEGSAADLTTQASYVEVTQDGMTSTPKSFSAPVMLACSSTTASSGDDCGASVESNGIIFDTPYVGYFEVCTQINHLTTSSVSGDLSTQDFQIKYTQNASQTIIEDIGMELSKSWNADSVSDRLNNILTGCGTVYFSSIGQKTLRLMYKHAGTFAISRVYKTQWTVKPSSQHFPQAVVLTDIDPTQMSVSEATRLGHYIYEHGGSYNNGLAPTITNVNDWLVAGLRRTMFIPKQMQDGSWLCDVYVAGQSSSSIAAVDFDVAGMDVDSGSSGYDIPEGIGINSASAYGSSGATGNTTYTTFTGRASTAGSAWIISHTNLLLTGKPTWAY